VTVVGCGEEKMDKVITIREPRRMTDEEVAWKNRKLDSMGVTHIRYSKLSWDELGEQYRKERLEREISMFNENDSLRKVIQKLKNNKQ